MRTLRELVVIAVLVLIAAILVPIRMHESGWLKGADDSLAKVQNTLGSVQSAADTGNMAATEVLNAAGSADKLITHADRSLSKFDAVLDAAVVLEAQATDTTKEIGDRADVTMNDLDTKISEVVDNVPELLTSTRGTLDAATQLMQGPLTQNSNALTTALIPAGLFMSDVRQYEYSWLYPPKQTKLMKAYHFLKAVAPLAQPTYYGFKIYKGD